MPTDSSSEVKFEIGHVLFIDIVGYSKLLISEQKKCLRQLTDIVLASAQVRAGTNEQLVKLPTGDGMALVFRNNPEEPAHCALEVAQALQALPDVRVRMGIHSGPVSEVTDVSDRPNIAGAGINMAQRVMDCGDAGHILVSQHVADDLAQYSQWRSSLHELGECEVKHGVRISIVNLYTDEIGNSELPQKFKPTTPAVRTVPKWVMIAVIVLILGAIGAGLLSLRQRLNPTAVTTPGIIPEKSIAVMPFENLSSDEENAYFADGIQDEILTRLSKIADLKVISRTSTQHYKSAPENLPEIARQLGVAHIVEGSVQKSGDAVRVNVQLIKAANDSHLWADTFDRKLTDIFSVESEVAKTIANQLQAKLTGREAEVIAAKPTDNVEAYDAYLRGLVYERKTARSSANDVAAQKYLREAVRLDPKFALSWALLSYVDASGYISLSLQPTTELREEARQAAATALNLQPNLGEALIANGYFHYACLKDYDTAERDFEQARRFLPNSSLIPQSMAYLLRRKGEWDRSESYFSEAERLDPRNVSLFTQHALSYVALRRFPEALRKLEQVLNITPDDPYPVALKASIAQLEGDLPRAAALLTPLHPNADNTQILEVQTYQAILERRPEQMIVRLKEVLANPDPALGYNIGGLRFYLGWAEEVAGDDAAAQDSWRQARSELEPLLKEQPGNYLLISALALSDMGLGDKAAALSLAEHAMAGNPIEEDALIGARPLEIFARVAAGTGETDRAIAAIQKLLSIPYSGPIERQLPLTPALLRLDPMFDPLRNDPRFEELCAEKQP
jgi:TolB-like protein/Tfp pilus assembly protein PilF